MDLEIRHQTAYSRGELLLRSFLGFWYILLPHFLLLGILAPADRAVSLVSKIFILFTGRYPDIFYQFNISLLRWRLRVLASTNHLTDEYPQFGPEAESESVTFTLPRQSHYDVGLFFLRLFFAPFYVLLPHGFMLFFYSIWVSILSFIAWWVVLFSGTFPQSFHEQITGFIRWWYRVELYMANMTDDYPPFHGRAE